MNRYQSSISAYLIVCLLSVVASHEAMASSCQDCQGTNTVTIEGGDLTIEYADKGFMATSRSLILDNLEDKAEVGAANTIGCGQDVIKDVRSGDLGSLYSCMQGLKGSEGPISNVELEDFRQKALNELKNEQINNMDTLESQVQNDVVGIYYNTDPTDSSPFDVIYEMKKIEALIVGPDMVEGLPEHIGIAGNYPATQELYGYMVENGYIGKWAEAIVTPGDITPEDCREFINFQDKEEYLAEQAEDADEKALVAQLYTKLCYGIKTTKSFKGVDDEKVSILDSALNIHSLAIEHGLQPHQISQSALGIWFSAGLSNMMNSFKDTIGGLFGGDGETETTQWENAGQETAEENTPLFDVETTIDPKTGEKVFASFADGLGSFGNSLFGQYDDGSAMVGTLSDHRARIEAGARGAISDYIDMNWFGETKQEIFDDKVAVLNSQLNTGKVSQDEYNKQAANLSQTYISHDSNYTSDQYETAYDQQLDRYLADEITLEELEQMENNGSIMANYSAPSTMVSDIWDGTVAAGNITTTIVTDGAIGVVDGVTGAIEWAASPDPDGFVVDGEGNQELKFVDVDVDGYVKEITAATHNDGSYSYQVVGEDSVRVYPDGNVIKTNDQGDVTEEYYATTDTTIKYSENRDGNTIETITFSDGSYKEVIYDSYFSQDTTTIYDKAKNSTTTYNADTGVQTEVRKDSYDNITYERIEYNDGGLIDSHSFEEYDRTTGQVRIGDQNGGEIVIQGVTDYDDFDTNLEINADGTPVIPDTYSYKQFNNDEGLIWGEETYVIHDADNGITTTGSEDGKVTTVYANNTVTVLSPNGEFTTTYTSGYTTYGTLDDDGGLGVYNNAGDLLFTENPDQTVTYPADQSEYWQSYTLHPDGSKSVVNPETNRTDIFMTDGSARQLDDDGNIISEYNGVSGEHVVYNEDGDVVERQVPDKYTFTADPEAGTWTRVDHSLKQTTSLSEDGSMSIHLEGESTTTVVRPDAVIETRETINGEQKITSTTQFDGGGNKQIMMYEYNGNGDLIDVWSGTYPPMSQTETPDGRVMYTYSDDSVVTIDNSVFGDANWTYTDTGDIYSADTDGNLSVDLAYRNNIGSDGAAIDFVNSVSDRLDNGDGTFTVITTDLSTGDISTATEDENGNTFSIKTGESAITDLYNKYGSSSSDSFMTAFKKDIDRLVSGGGIGPWVFVLEGKAMKMGKFYDFKTGLIETWNFLGDSIQEIGNFTDYYGNHSARRANADQAVYLLEFQKIRELKKRQDDPWRPESIEMGSLYYKNSDIMALDFRLQNPEIANVYTLPEKQLGPTVQAAKEKDLYDRLDLKSDTDYNLISSACDGSLDHIAENKVVPVDLNIEEQCQEYIDEQLDKSWLDSSLDFFANVSDAGSTVSQSISRLAEYANFLPTYDAEDPNNPIRLANIEGDLRSQGRYLSESQIREEQRSISNKVYLKFAQEYNQYTKAVQDKKTEYTNLGCGINSMADQSCGSLAREIATITEKQNDAEYMLSNPSSLVSESNLKFADTTASEVDKNDQSLDALSQDIYDDRAIREGQADSVMDMIEQINQMNLMIYQDLADINQVVVAISNLPVCDWK